MRKTKCGGIRSCKTTCEPVEIFSMAVDDSGEEAGEEMKSHHCNSQGNSSRCCSQLAGCGVYRSGKRGTLTGTPGCPEPPRDSRDAMTREELGASTPESTSQEFTVAAPREVKHPQGRSQTSSRSDMCPGACAANSATTANIDAKKSLTDAELSSSSSSCSSSNCNKNDCRSPLEKVLQKTPPCNTFPKRDPCQRLGWQIQDSGKNIAEDSSVQYFSEEGDVCRSQGGAPAASPRGAEEVQRRSQGGPPALSPSDAEEVQRCTSYAGVAPSGPRCIIVEDAAPCRQRPVKRARVDDGRSSAGTDRAIARLLGR